MFERPDRVDEDTGVSGGDGTTGGLDVKVGPEREVWVPHKRVTGIGRERELYGWWVVDEEVTPEGAGYFREYRGSR